MNSNMFIYLLRTLLLGACVFLLCGCSERNFQSRSDCRNYVQKSAVTDEKLSIGLWACSWNFVELDKYAPLPISTQKDEGQRSNDPSAIAYKPLFSDKELLDEAVAARDIATSKKKLATCVIKKIDQIQDDESGARVLRNCGNSTKEVELARILAWKFSPSKRIEIAIEKQQKERTRIAEEQRENYLSWSQGMPSMDLNSLLPTMIEINGELKTCIRVGVILDCD